jgi:hypothetical protein
MWLISLVVPALAFWLFDPVHAALQSTLSFAAVILGGPILVAGAFSMIRVIRKSPAFFWACALGGMALLAGGILLVSLVIRAVPELGEKAWGFAWLGLLAALVILHDAFIGKAGFLFGRFWAWLLWRLPLRAARNGRRLAAAYSFLALALGCGIALAAALTHGFRPQFEAPGARFSTAPLPPGQLALALCGRNNRGDQALLASPGPQGSAISDSASLHNKVITLLGQVSAPPDIADGGTWYLARLADGTEGYIESGLLEARASGDGVAEYGEEYCEEALALGRPHAALVARSAELSRGAGPVRVLEAGSLVDVKETLDASSILDDDSVVGNENLIQLVDPSCGAMGGSVLIVAEGGKAWANPWAPERTLDIPAGTRATLLGACAQRSDIPVSGDGSLALAALRLSDGRTIFMNREEPLFCATEWQKNVIGARIEPQDAPGSPDPVMHLEEWKPDGSAILDQGERQNACVEGLAVYQLSPSSAGGLSGTILVERSARHFTGDSNAEGKSEEGGSAGSGLTGVYRSETASWLETEQGLTAPVCFARLRSLAIVVEPSAQAESGDDTPSAADGLSLRVRQSDFIDEKGVPMARIRLDFESPASRESDEERDFTLDYPEGLWSLAESSQEPMRIESRSGMYPRFQDVEDFASWLSVTLDMAGAERLSGIVQVDNVRIR